jgi:hypothetical protein
MNRKNILAILFAVIVLIGLILIGKLVETNKSGEFQVKQAFISGTMSARMIPGTYGQWFGDIETYRNVATIGFGKEVGEGSADIEAIPIIFNDGSKATISGLVRIKLPSTQEEVIKLKLEYANGYNHFINSGVLPIIKNAVKLSANLRSAQDAYTTLALFQQDVENQLRQGIYKTKSDLIEIERSTGDKEELRVTVVVTDKNGLPITLPNRLKELGCEVLECVIDVPAFDAKVEEMISKRKDEAMKTELAKQEAIRAKQDAITAEEQGRANVAKAKYEKEVEKEKAVVEAQKKFEVAQLQAKEAGEKKKAVILAAEAKKQELLIADGLSERAKYEIDKRTEAIVKSAEALSKWVGPQVVFSGGGDGKTGQSGIENALMIKMMDDMVKSHVNPN